MFGKPEWFRENPLGWGVYPTSRNGWIYTGVWKAVMGLPFLGLLGMGKYFESIVWLAASTGVFLWDIRTIAKAKKQTEADANLLYIKDEGEDASRLTTEKYDLEIRE